ncbi:MAG TPA: flagellar basal-body MS-ring/collar protein FliF [Solirubrobacteraceae bacterium]|nr:flagellar basal-body MS-ring/collar protein FliF [Solirubrobacteraceae bacterium]
MGSAMDLVKRLSPKGWAMVGGAFAAAVVFIVIVMQFASAPSYATLETGIDPSQTNKITATLATQGIPYQIQNGGTAVAVVSSKTAQARVALASAGLLGSYQPGFSLLDKQSLGQSNFQQQVTYERALEGQLASTIETINGVSSAQVNLVIPDSQNQLFADQTQPATASVLLSGAENLQPGAVRGIAQLVASSVPGLAVNKVTISGANGTELWPSNTGGGSGSGLPAAQAAAQKYDSAMSTEVEALLAQTLGVGNAQVVVNATLNDNRATQESLVYGKKGTLLNANTSNQTLKGTGSGASGAAGTSSNIPAYSANSGSGKGSSNYRNASNRNQYGVDKTITHSVIAPGAIQRQSVSVLVNSKVPAADIPAIKKAVAQAVGLNAARGDSIAVSQLKFAPATTTTVKPAAANPIMKYAKYGILGLGAVLFLFFMMRAIRKREKDSFGQPKWLSELESPRPLAALEASAPTEVVTLHPHIGVARRQIEDLVSRDPELVAQHLRAWMSED